MSKKLQPKQKDKIEETILNLRGICRHKQNVLENTIILGEKLVEQGEINLGKNLIANGYSHDISKFFGIEWAEMAPNTAKNEQPDKETKKMKLKLAIANHNQTNLHHVEAWGCISEMPDVYLAEMCCDLLARSQEFGTSLMDYIDDEGIKRWKISKDESVYKKIIKYVNLLCEKPFAATP